jgi:hypothetical protein
MSKYLVVAHQTAASPELIARLKELQERDDQAQFVLLVPATSSAHLLTWVEGESEQIAQRRAAQATSTLRQNGLSVTNTLIGEADPLKALDKELRENGDDYAMTVISTLPPGLSRWFRRDLQHQLQNRFGNRVAIVVAGQMRPASATAEQEIHLNGEPVTLRQFYNRLGQTVHCADGLLGNMREVLYDYLTRVPLWVVISYKPLGVRPMLIPARALWDTGTHLETAMTKAQIEGQPAVTIGEGFSSLTEEENIWRYFGLPFDEVRDTRVLREHEEFPGQERVVQNIMASDRAS